MKYDVEESSPVGKSWSSLSIRKKYGILSIK